MTQKNWVVKFTKQVCYKQKKEEEKLQITISNLISIPCLLKLNHLHHDEIVQESTESWVKKKNRYSKVVTHLPLNRKVDSEASRKNDQ